jgi:hypothetical protein
MHEHGEGVEVSSIREFRAGVSLRAAWGPVSDEAAILADILES